MDLLNLVQWPAMLVTLVASWLVASRSQAHRNVGFWVFLLSNAMWVVWGVHAKSWALVVLQVGLMVLNIRGARKTDEPEKSSD